MTAPFDSSAHQSAHVLLDRLVELEVPLSRDVMYAFERLIVTSWYDRGLWTTPWFPEYQVEPGCSTCGATMAASRTVQVTDTETVERRLYECGAVEAVSLYADAWPVEALAPCGDTERRVAADLARTYEAPTPLMRREAAILADERAERDATPPAPARTPRLAPRARAQLVTGCMDCGDTGGGREPCVPCCGTGLRPETPIGCPTCDDTGWATGRCRCPACSCDTCDGDGYTDWQSRHVTCGECGGCGRVGP
jgi:hypothetical protein